ncbi:MxaK protein [Methylocystis echinoides]|uniref:MxaK protein n=1 Tax=Methylocystis echinoides TaxID=29468 RepID=UPI002490BF8C|nr:MxaK protein [Methylocystis echinoides]
MTSIRFLEDLRRFWRRSRSTILVGLALALGATAIGAFVNWRRVGAANKVIEALRLRRDIDIGVDARSEVLLARIGFLSARNEFDRARILLEALDRNGAPHTRARGHYLLANSLLRQALTHIEGSELDAASPFVNLAKREYRRALQLYPDFWDAKYNLDVAARLVRDFPDFDRKGGDELSADPKKLWTDIPGKPKGLP